MILDASAVLAIIFSAPGFEVFAGAISDASHAAYLRHICRNDDDCGIPRGRYRGPPIGWVFPERQDFL